MKTVLALLGLLLLSISPAPACGRVGRVFSNYGYNTVRFAPVVTYCPPPAPVVQDFAAPAPAQVFTAPAPSYASSPSCSSYGGAFLGSPAYGFAASYAPFLTVFRNRFFVHRGFRTAFARRGTRRVLGGGVGLVAGRQALARRRGGARGGARARQRTLIRVRRR